MKTFPYEVLRNIGTFLNQVEQKECSRVCHSWLAPFRALVFQKAVLLHLSQLQRYNEQAASLRRLTQSLHINVPLTDAMLLDFAEASPNVHTLTLFVNLLNNLSIPKTLTVIRTYWLKSLTKIRMDGLLLPEVLPLLCHQLEDVTGDWRGFYDENRQIIPMPKLRILDIEDDYSANERMLSSRLLNSIRVAYPQLRKLSVGYFFVGTELMEEEGEEWEGEYAPFPFVRSFHIMNCDELDDAYPSFRKLFKGLKEYSLVRSTPQDDEEIRLKTYADLVVDHPAIHTLKIDHCTKDPVGLFDVLSKLKDLRSLHLELTGETGVITKRYRINLSQLLLRLPQLKKLNIWGLAHIGVGESLEHYLCGTAGFFDAGCKEEDEYESPEMMSRVAPCVTYDSDVFVGDHPYFGNGEELMTEGLREVVVKKHFPENDRWPVYGRLNFSTSHMVPGFTCQLTSLHLTMTTLRNPTFQWLALHCPMLQELFVLQSEPYPYFVVELGERLRTFEWSFDERYIKYGPPPLVTLNGSRYFRYISVTGYVQVETDSFQDTSFRIDIHHGPKLASLKICEHTLSINSIQE
ncbi:uncharacterized protein EV154DRAFT_605197 [Mucor mucedo]|uniref:uncharacterized protein n=1 Tax=Mucor mucedo TaxID=29922 RepID=UPI0022211F51|nr:uncharacterized protein EV154DRAFT_605197 [Mucor mucedo]KAI7887982.1 hypothetical protein EV154DRAFT_605197 [Mucor mucedo]